MLSRNVLRVSVFALIAVAAAGAPAADLFKVDQKLWKPAPDDVFLQEINGKVPTDSPVLSVALFNDTLYAVMEGTVHMLRADRLEVVHQAPKKVSRLESLGGALWAVAESGTYRFTGDAWSRVDERQYVDFCMHLGAVHAATRDEVFRFENGMFVTAAPEGGYLSSDSTVVMEDGTQVLSEPVPIGPVERIASYSGTLYILRPGQLVALDGRRVVPSPIDWGALPSPRTRDMMSLGSCLYITTDRGLGVLRGMAMTALQGKDGLPYEDTTCVVRGFDNDLWIGTTTGAIRKTEGEYHYFGPYHWLPGNNVHDIAVGDKVVYAATDGGIGVIRYEPYTLLKKAAYFEQRLDEWGHKRLGFIHKLYWGGDDKGWIREISDNDGGHTAHYLAAMSFKYAVTGDEKAREQAVDAFKAMVWLDEITPEPGFFARAIWSKTADLDKMSEQGSGGLPAKWYPTPDGLWMWKGDTSSDEVDGHFYSVSIFHDLAAKGAEKERAKKHLSNIASHILDNGWVLRDMDGKPTRWGRWDPDYLLRPYGFEARGLNGMQAQTYMRAAFGVTGNQKFEDGFQQLLKWGYHTYTWRQKLTFPPDLVVPWDDELAFRCYYTLLRFTDDPAMRSIYLRSIERHWEVKRMEHVPWFNFIYGAITGNDCEVDRAVKHLREWSLDTINYSYRNSHRNDLFPEPGYTPYQGGTKAMSPRETEAKEGSRFALQYDGGAGGKTVTVPAGWLEDYWMGRYHGFIEAPKVTDPALTTVEPSTGEPKGAAPYNGPPRPANLVPGEP